MAAITRRPLMAGNWKMNLNHFEANLLVQKLAASLTAQQLTDVECVVLPPFTDLRTVQTAIEGDKLLIGYGGQDLSPYPSGAYTGDISGAMLAKLGCTYVVVGHSERRQYHHEDDALVNDKVTAALSHGLTPILCIGEGLEVREQLRHVPHCCDQLDGALRGLTPEQVTKVVVAYEPVWAIGTGKTATPEDAQEVCGEVRKRLVETYDQATADQVRILYGGSVKSSNVASIMAQPDVDGALVGGASLDGEEFAKICRFPEHISR
ncbi:MULTISPECIES: triose-phosphate isomerase [Micromonospora]|uniref:triose-phosphate isomerase n=1 Tax=Micromonospora TaxID=1873 RepID=UPI00098D111C|nr:MULTISPECIES: triose-phosphate isomerase [unclassified Micromonospora]MDI5937214.1 triose-phosphate isomerase [Micromonospora sp. DH15]OON28566.1 triose-phosphate isomerase [Micromonospora sp. Rc5]WFE57019.1 triose-phosphate isomerase [Micromonospora sp. WMMD712]